MGADRKQSGLDRVGRVRPEARRGRGEEAKDRGPGLEPVPLVVGSDEGAIAVDGEALGEESTVGDSVEGRIGDPESDVPDP